MAVAEVAEATAGKAALAATGTRVAMTPAAAVAALAAVSAAVALAAAASAGLTLALAWVAESLRKRWTGMGRWGLRAIKSATRDGSEQNSGHMHLIEES